MGYAEEQIKDYMDNLDQNYAEHYEKGNLPEDESNLLDAQVIKLLADRHINIIELKHLMNKVKRVKIKDDLERILIKDLGESYDRIEDKNFIGSLI